MLEARLRLISEALELIHNPIMGLLDLRNMQLILSLQAKPYHDDDSEVSNYTRDYPTK